MENNETLNQKIIYDKEKLRNALSIITNKTTVSLFILFMILFCLFLPIIIFIFLGIIVSIFLLPFAIMLFLIGFSIKFWIRVFPFSSSKYLDVKIKLNSIF